MAISKDDIQKLREKTSAGVMDCKKALEEANGDFNKAEEIIKEKGVVIAEKKSERKTGAGILYSYIHNDRVGVLLELRSETDFVAKRDDFKELAHEIAMQIASMDPENVDSLMEQPYIREPEKNISDLIKELISKVKENIELERFCRYEI
ncbi:MAG: translation elongation factor Ts [Candidatus Paceibacterota bacterium]